MTPRREAALAADRDRIAAAERAGTDLGRLIAWRLGAWPAASLRGIRWRFDGGAVIVHNSRRDPAPAAKDRPW